ncbi:MAG TPA: porin [Candidatus Sutterella merdavium]|nr:porin [Candidatus Sutterella merdavium]
MKKSLIALAVASAAMAGSAYAANVEVYGLLDTSLAYVYADPDASGHDGEGKFTMENAREFGSRFGLRGSEDLGNGMKVGFVLESGIKSDSGELDQGGRLFGREAHINLRGDFGYLAFGLQPIFGSTLGAHGLFRAIDPLFANYTEAFGSGHASASMWTRVDNAISYVTPTWAGFTFYGMYSFQNSSKTATGYYKDGAREGSGEVDRYGALAARYQAGALESVLVWDMTTYGNERTTKPTDKYGDNIDHGMTTTFGGNYTFANGLKVLAFGQWFKDQELGRRAGVMSGALKAHEIVDGSGAGNYGFVDGYGVSLGVNYPIGGGVAKAQVAYRDMENQNDIEFNRWTIAAAYDYPLSKRTAVYAMTGYTQESMEGTVGSKKVDADPSGYEFTVGMVHRF